MKTNPCPIKTVAFVCIYTWHTVNNVSFTSMRTFPHIRLLGKRVSVAPSPNREIFRTETLQSFYLPVIKERIPFETNVSASSTAWCRDARLAVLVKALLIIPAQALFFLSADFKPLLLWKLVYMLVNRQEQAFRK